ncbi:hypothetical protein D9757_000652 [Collybiopsis confluens]|uniref:Cation efflux protein cytoplasmic domain-containing protein n=1 Tax=Collybiopsis confluens TaxID=2823264 RepID=A0A8H5I1K8_9AGAR|nr:hypothetical protein D9757_000652 [Collybiopsis confluens]
MMLLLLRLPPSKSCLAAPKLLRSFPRTPCDRSQPSHSLLRSPPFRIRSNQLHFIHWRNNLSTPPPTLNMHRRPHSTQNGNSEMKKEPTHEHGHSHSDSHSHSFFGGHSHAGEYNYGAERIMAAWEGAGDKGSQITIIGLLSNVVLTGVKGAAGWYMHSASLLADAGHSLSDLLGDFVTLFCWKLSRKPPSERFPYGYAKYETLGTTTVSLLLIGGALGIGFHSYHILLTALTETAASLPSGPVQSVLQNVTSTIPDVPHALSQHSHVETVDPNAAWFAALSVLIKEWLYRITKSRRIFEFYCAFRHSQFLDFSENSSRPHRRFNCVLVILQQGVGLLAGAWGDLTDASVSAKTKQVLKQTLDPLVISPSSSYPIDKPAILSVTELRARRAGSLIFVDLTAEVPSSMTVKDLTSLEEIILSTLQEKRKEVTEVRVKFKPRDM